MQAYHKRASSRHLLDLSIESSFDSLSRPVTGFVGMRPLLKAGHKLTSTEYELMLLQVLCLAQIACV